MAKKQSGGSKPLKTTKAAPAARIAEKIAAKVAAKKTPAKTVIIKKGSVRTIDAAADSGKARSGGTEDGGYSLRKD